MRDPQRIPAILAKLTELWMKNPDLRLGQIISNAFALAKQNDANGSVSTDLFFVEDDGLMIGLQKLSEQTYTQSPYARSTGR